MRNLLLTLTIILTTAWGAVAQGPSQQNVGDDYANLIDLKAKPMFIADFNFTIFDAGVNTKYTEYGSTFFMGKYIIISARKIGGLGGTKDKLTNESYTELFCADIDQYGNLSRPLLFSRIINTLSSEGSVAFTPDQKVIYYTRNTQENSEKYQLYRAVLDKVQTGKWVNEELIPFSGTDYSIENPSITTDGKRMFFTSNMEGGLGGYDIYYVDIHENGALGTPVNLGSEINTADDEKYPYMSPDNKHLYFSSNGHNSLGGLDVYRAKRVFDNYVRPLNLGTTINSEADDYAFIMSSKDRGYFTSDRAEGKGKSDIYKYIKEDITQTIQGTVVDRETRIPLPNTVIELIDEEGNVVATKTTTEEAKFEFDIDPFDVYTIKTTRDGFDDNIVDFESNTGRTKDFAMTVEMDPSQAEIVEVDDKMMIAIENIYFDYDKWLIKKESTISLNKIVDVLNANPDMKIEINAHTDSRGRDAYNLSLSKKRAASAMKFLIANGIDGNRLVSNGYGETQPLFDCGSDCSEEQYELNRRIEFVIIK
ncbi:MAG: OmpA family protein [Flavobacteriaceae bacterium]|nr:OmpA family protein [Flavobacteriaceae bacterium]